MTKNIKIKVCGLRDGENIREVVALGVDYIGLIFQEGSPYNVTMIPTHAGIIPDRADVQSSLLNGQCKRVGVFVDEMPQNIITRVVNFQLDVIQMHGHESPTVIRNLRATLDPDIRPGIQLWKTVSIRTVDDLSACEQYANCVDAFVFDMSCDSGGGSATPIDWNLLNAYHGPVPFLLSGCIGPDEAEEVKTALSATHSTLNCMGIDLHSPFESAPAIKDVALLRQFLERLT